MKPGCHARGMEMTPRIFCKVNIKKLIILIFMRAGILESV